ncbi:hypothetical protein [Lewinella sp. 4G2]|uniref:hypothetical protein n=1 Tax=Lewinella sp. 4G2 TaxID=1803372 RepID=UPI0007B4913D|nr:hypothetical protein [Lewinella sp. 4G2]OAV44901.1 hypothetical protein A3850_010530 [Lewinella sp. 4G2]
MSLAIGALLVAILLLPGIVFRYLYIRSDALRKTIDLSLLSEAVFILIPSLLLHLFGRLVAEHLLGWDINLRQIYLLLTNSSAIDFALIDEGYPFFVGYILTLCILAGALAIGFQQLVVRLGWDERYKLLRIYNDWDKFFSGHALPKAEREQIEFIQVDVVCSSSAGDVLYTGVLENYSLNKDQGIDRIFLSNAFRRELKDDLQLDSMTVSLPADYPSYRTKDFDDRYYALPGAYFVIPFGEIKNLNIIYNTLKETSAPATDSLIVQKAAGAAAGAGQGPEKGPGANEGPTSPSDLGDGK